MISIIVDEAYAFDYLSILEVKTTKLRKGFREFRDCEHIIMAQIGHEKFNTVRASDEYRALLQANFVVFNLVERLKTDPSVTAFEVDDGNHLRYLCKKRLQAAFFTTTLKETKTYDPTNDRD